MLDVRCSMFGVRLRPRVFLLRFVLAVACLLAPHLYAAPTNPPPPAAEEALPAGRAAARVAQGGAPGAPSASGLAWTAPTGWSRGPASGMRVVTFLPEGAADTECYVAVLGGAGAEAWPLPGE